MNDMTEQKAKEWTDERALSTRYSHMALHEIAEFVDGHVPIAVNVHLCQDFFARGRTFYLLDVLFVSSMHRGVIRLGLYNEFSKLVHAACLVLYFSDDLSFLSPLLGFNLE